MKFLLVLESRVEVCPLRRDIRFSDLFIQLIDREKINKFQAILILFSWDESVQIRKSQE